MISLSLCTVCTSDSLCHIGILRHCSLSWWDYSRRYCPLWRKDKETQFPRPFIQLLSQETSGTLCFGSISSLKVLEHAFLMRSYSGPSCVSLFVSPFRISTSLSMCSEYAFASYDWLYTQESWVCWCCLRTAWGLRCLTRDWSQRLCRRDGLHVAPHREVFHLSSLPCPILLQS